MLPSKVSLDCHFGTKVHFFVDYHSLAQAIADDYVMTLLSDSLRCSVASVVTGLSKGHQRVMQQVQTRFLASNKSLSVYTVIWCIRICFNCHMRALMCTPSCIMLPVLALCT